MSKYFNFDDIGKKIMNFAKWSCWAEIVLIWVGSIITFFVFIFDANLWDLLWIPFATAIVGPFVIWLSYLALYAFGQLVDDSRTSKSLLEIIANTEYSKYETSCKKTITEEANADTNVHKPITEMKSVTEIRNQVDGNTWVCGKCGKRNLLSNDSCWSCGNFYEN